MNKKTAPTEAQEQKTVIEWAKLNENKYPELEWLHHIPNGGSRHVAEAVSLKLQGVKAGISDLFLPVPRGVYHGLYIELKRTTEKKKGVRSMTKSQVDFATFIQSQGYAFKLCFGADETIKTLKYYLKLEEKKSRC